MDLPTKGNEALPNFNYFRELADKNRDIIKKFDFTKLPISELHVHAEGGTLTQSMIEQLASKNQQTLSEGLIFTPEGNISFEPKNFMDFLRVYDLATKVIVTESDIEMVIYDYLKRCAEEGAVYIELSCSADHVKQNRVEYGQLNSQTKAQFLPETTGMTYRQFVDALVRAIDRAKQDFGIEARILMILLRHNGAQHCMNTMYEIESYLHPYIKGINLAGDEAQFGPDLFAESYQKAAQLGLKRTAHAGEHTPPQFTKEAVKKLGLNRVGHGVTSIHDIEIIEFLKRNNIGLEICPTSNLALGLFDSIETHPVRKLFDAGVQLSINSDDPTYFGTSLGKEYALLKEKLNFSDEELLQLCNNSIEMSFAENTLKEKLLARIEMYQAFQCIKKQILLPQYNHSIVQAYFFASFEELKTPRGAYDFYQSCQINFGPNHEITKLANSLRVAERKFIHNSNIHDSNIEEAVQKFGQSFIPVERSLRKSFGTMK